MTTFKRVFKVNEEPFFPIGGQSCNSSGYNDKESEMAFKCTELLHGNTLEIPVYWEQVEPEECKFDFTSVDALLSSARKHRVKLILLWFATWKNGNMDYAPQWVKVNPERFKRVISPTNKELWNLSSHCPANLDADKKAFIALCKYLKDKDSKEQTVICIQIENEPGIMGSDRDYGSEAQAIFDSPSPAKLVAKIKGYGKGPIYDIWKKSGSINSGNWSELFGWEAGEIMTAWSIANYIDGIAESGKAVYNIPMYVNVWLMEQNWWSIPGESYPSGGAVTKVLDIYKWFTPHLDFIAPDNYQKGSKGFEAVCINYSRDDNPFFMPETEGDQNMFRAIADYNSLGYFFMGVEHIITEDGTIRQAYQTIIDNIRCTSAIIPLILKYQFSGKIHAVIQEDKLPSQLLDFDGYTGLIEFGEKKARWVGKDWRHDVGWKHIEQNDINIGRGLVIQTSRHEFFLVGVNYRLYLRPHLSLEKMQAPLLIADGTAKTFSYIISVDEGSLDSKGEFVANRRRSGDEIGRQGLWVEPDIGVLRVITCD